uniref:G domain-containing protein n=1 Tax=Heterorhabditis bacteriophora TaxID=37862 RepID=A0A1I7WMT6_HETBA
MFPTEHETSTPIHYRTLIGFVQHTDRILADGFVPNEVDILYSYTPTIGLDEHLVRLGKQLYGIQELPGHHIFRRRWKDFFRYTSVIVFLIDLCELCDGAFYTGHLKNKTTAIFEELVKNEHLKNVGFILFFNKKDAFDEQSRGFDFKQLASNVRSAEEALAFYRTSFTAISPKRSYHHVVSLLDAPNLGNIVTESLNRIFQYNAQIITSV